MSRDQQHESHGDSQHADNTLKAMEGVFLGVLHEHESAQLAKHGHRPPFKQPSWFAKLCYWWERGADVKR